MRSTPRLFCLAAGLGAVALASLLTATWEQGFGRAGSVALVAAFVMAYVAVEAVSLRLPQGGRLSIGVGVSVVSLVMMPAAIALAAQSAGQVLFAALDEDELDVGRLLRDVVRRLAALGVGFLVYQLVGESGLVGAEPQSTLLALMAAGTSYMLLDLIGYVVSSAPLPGASRWHSLVSLVRLVGWAYLSQLSVGIVFVVVAEGLGLLAAPILLLLMLLLQSSFGLLLRVRTAYVSTVGALARLAERQSPEGVGHAERVAALCVAAGRRLRLSHEYLEALSFAATLHDIGYLKLPETQLMVGHEYGLDPRAAEAGASVIDAVEFLAPAAQVLRALALADDCESADATAPDRVMVAILESACLCDHMRGSTGAESAETVALLLRNRPSLTRFPAVIEAMSELAAAGATES